MEPIKPSLGLDPTHIEGGPAFTSLGRAQSRAPMPSRATTSESNSISKNNISMSWLNMQFVRLRYQSYWNSLVQRDPGVVPGQSTALDVQYKELLRRKLTFL
ncbi:hypothetical protein Fot_54782 [Forsythia ovata]|uniref:Uncharacterized protein n=1 Tax=Forsythia ovata TaxID=205694 RepID=A0ABD1P832_9LAMI